MISADEVYKIGQLTRTHGVCGELAFRFIDDVWDRVEADYLFLQLDGLLVPFFLEEWRFRSDDVALLKFEDIDSADQAQHIVGAEVYFPKHLTPDDVDELELEWRHFTDFEVYNIDSQSSEKLIGKVVDVLDQTANVLLVVLTPAGKEVFVPAHEDFIIRADHRERHLYVNVPDELLNLNC